MAKKIKDAEQVEVDTSTVRDELSSIISKDLSKQFKDLNQVVWYLDGPEDAPTEIQDWISTGSSLLDLAISNRPYGGLPVGRITEITGLESSGKSLVAAHLLAETQRKAGTAVFIDTESAVSEAFLTAIGVNISKMMYIPLDTVEDIFQAIESVVNSVRNNDKKRLVTIVVDSLAAASTKVEMEGNYDQSGYATQKAIILSKAMRKITNLIARERICLVFTNQLRQKMNAMAFSDPYTTSGGKAVGFHSSVRLRLSNSGALKKKDWGGVDQIIGNKVEAKVTKNRLGPPQRKASFEMFYDSGIDNYSGWLKVLATYKLIKQGGAYYTYDIIDSETGEVTEQIKFMAKDLVAEFEKNPLLKESMYKDLCKIMIMEYKKNGDVIAFDSDIEEDNTEEIPED